jgi:hypothetical protein
MLHFLSGYILYLYNGLVVEQHRRPAPARPVLSICARDRLIPMLISCSPGKDAYGRAGDGMAPRIGSRGRCSDQLIEGRGCSFDRNLSTRSVMKPNFDFCG